MTGPELAAAGLPHNMEDDDDLTANTEALLGFSGSGGGWPARPTVTPPPWSPTPTTLMLLTLQLLLLVSASLLSGMILNLLRGKLMVR
jgi:hypothetical protein